jgi:hypothetical protein
MPAWQLDFLESSWHPPVPLLSAPPTKLADSQVLAVPMQSEIL